MCCALLVSSAAEPDGLERRRTLLPGTDGSNPLPPSAESGTNRRAGGRRTRSALPLVRPTTAAMSFGLLSGASVPQSAPEARRYPRRGRLQLIHEQLIAVRRIRGPHPRPPPRRPLAPLSPAHTTAGRLPPGRVRSPRGAYTVGGGKGSQAGSARPGEIEHACDLSRPDTLTRL
jgi:hypothetical protein